MGKDDLISFGGPNSIEDLENYFRARTKDIPLNAFNEIEAGLSRLKEAQERQLSDLNIFDDTSNDALRRLIKQQIFERQKLLQTFAVRWGSHLTTQILIGLGYDLSDYKI